MTGAGGFVLMIISGSGGFVLMIGSGGGFMVCLINGALVGVGGRAVRLAGGTSTAPTEVGVGLVSTAIGLSLGSARTPQDKSSEAGSTRTKWGTLFFIVFWRFYLVI